MRPHKIIRCNHNIYRLVSLKNVAECWKQLELENYPKRLTRGQYSRAATIIALHMFPKQSALPRSLTHKGRWICSCGCLFRPAGSVSDWPQLFDQSEWDWPPGIPSGLSTLPWQSWCQLWHSTVNTYKWLVTKETRDASYTMWPKWRKWQ